MKRNNAARMNGTPTTDSIISDEDAQPRLEMIRRLVAQPIPGRGTSWTDPHPAQIADGSVLIGNKHHAADIAHLQLLGVTAVLNCASGGISRLPVEALRQTGIQYAFTNVRQDNATYPILHDRTTGECSQHLQVAKQVYGQVKQENGKLLFFCVAGQNRSATLAVAVLLLYGKSLDEILESCAKTRSFILENVGFQRQLVELEAMLLSSGPRSKKVRVGEDEIYVHGTPSVPPMQARTASELALESQLAEIELLIPGLCTMDVRIPIESTISTVKECVIDHANKHLLSYSDSPSTVFKSWLVLAMFGYDDMYDFPLEVEAIDLNVQLQRMKTMFNLQVIDKDKEKVIRWTEKCRFALVILAVSRIRNGIIVQEPWTFVHEERPGAPATLLENTPMQSKLRAWDFVTGQAFASEHPIVFSFAKDPRDRRSFMQISTSANEMQQFFFPGEGGILGMGANAIVHRVKLKPTSAEGFDSDNEDNMSEDSEELTAMGGWDAAVKRPFGLSKMLAFLKSSSEAGVAKRLRFANALNSDGRVLYFYGLGLGMSANANNHQEYKWEVMLLARYVKQFSVYTMRRFMEDYVAIPDQAPLERRNAIIQLQTDFSLISVKLLLVNLLNAFRDLTLMGVQAFDFNHLNNVLVSQDNQTVQLIDIDGNSKGSIQFPSEYIEGPSEPSLDRRQPGYHKPSLDIDLNTVLPTVVQQLLLGKGRGNAFITNKKSEIWHAKPEDAKEIIKEVLRENFFRDRTPQAEDEMSKTEKHISKVATWFYAMLKKKSPWDNWTNDIYDALRCIDHLPIAESTAEAGFSAAMTEQSSMTHKEEAGACCFLWKFGVCEPPRPPCRFRHDISDDGITPCCFGATCRFGHAKRINYASHKEKLEYWCNYRSDGCGSKKNSNNMNVVGASPALRDATQLRSQLEPWPTAILRKRLATNFGEDHRQLDTLQRGDIMGLLLERYKDCPRKTIRVQGSPVDKDLCDLLRNELEAWSRHHMTNTRPSINAASYMILRSPVEFEQKNSNMAHKAARKLKQHEHLWNLARQAIASVDEEFANSFSALAVTKGFTGSPHIDKQNTGPFYGLALGDFRDGTGGVCVETDFSTIAHVNTKNRLAKVDGRYPHWVAPYEGTRYSLIFYSTWQDYQPPGPAFFGRVVEEHQ